MSQPQDPSLLQCILELNRQSRISSVAAFNEAALDAIATAIKYDSALWGSGAMVNQVPAILEAFARGVDRSFIDALNANSQHNNSSNQAFANPGVTVNRNADQESAEFQRTVLEPYKQQYVMLTVEIDSTSGVLQFLSLCRHQGSMPFSESERQCKQALMPHLQQATSANRIERALDLLDGGMRASYSVILANQSGIVLAAQRAATDLLRKQWPAWAGSVLPTELIDQIAAVATGAPSMSRFGAKLVARILVRGDQVLLRMRSPNAIDALTERERQIAESYSAGQSYKQIARLFGSSPSTVSNQLTAVYAKLAIHNKAELIALILQLT